jgi:sugar lactone lactonase YvrE
MLQTLAESRVLLDGLAIGESPRWHDGRLWLSNWGTGEIVAVDPRRKERGHGKWVARARVGGRMAPGWTDAHHGRGADPR